jgi:hypothetical protein
MTRFLIAAALACTAAAQAEEAAPKISGDYVEVRSCDVYTGPCFANGEMGLTGKEAMMVWAVKDGGWQDVSLEGLSVAAVLRTDNTLGDVTYDPQDGRAVVLVDEKANPEQREALTAFAKEMGGRLVKDVVEVKAVPMEVSIGTCDKSSGCASVKAGEVAEISTRCLGGKDHLCGNESNFYPPLTKVDNSRSAVTTLASFKDPALGLTFERTEERSAFLGTFAR